MSDTKLTKVILHDADLDVDANLSADGELLAQIRANTAKNGSGSSYVPLVDTDGHLQIDVLNYPGPSASQFPSSLTTSGNLKVAVLEGGAGGGLSQVQVRNNSNTWTDVGYYSGNLNMPVEVKASLPSGTNNIGDVDVLTYPGPSASQLPSSLTSSGNLKVAVLEGGAGGGLSQVQVRNGSNTWTDVGYYSGNLNVPVEVRVSLPAGTNTIGKLAANSGVDIGDVDVLSLPPDTFVAETGNLGKGVLIQGDNGTNRTNVLVDTDGHLQVDVLSGGGGGEQYADGVAVNPAYKGNLVLGTDGANYQILAVDSSGNLQVDVLSSALPSGAATAANQTTIIGYIDGVEGLLTSIDADTDNLSTIKTNTNFGTVVGGGTEANALRVTIASDSTGVISVDDGGGSLTVDGSVSLAASIPAGTNNIGDVDVLTYPGPSSSQLPSSLTASGNLKVAILEGGAGGGLSQIQVRNGSNAWTDVGYYTGNLSVPVEVKASLPAGTNNIGDVDVLSLPSDIDIRNLTKTSDEVYSVLRTDAGAAYDARDRSWTITESLTIGTLPSLPAGNNNIGDVDVLTYPGPSASQLPSSLTASGNLKVAVLEGGAGGGLSQIQVRDSSNAWTDVGYYTGNLNVPVEIKASLPSGTNVIGAVKDAGPNWTPSFTANEWTSAQTDATVISAPGSGVSIYITDIVISTSSAQTILLEQGTSTQLYKFYFAANGGAVMNFRTPRKLASNTALTITTAAGNVSLEIHYYTA